MSSICRMWHAGAGRTTVVIARSNALGTGSAAERFRAMPPEEGEKILDGAIPGLNQLFALPHQRRIGQYFGSQANTADRQIQQEENPG